MTQRGLLTAIVAAGLLLRLLHLWFISQTAFLEFPLTHVQSDMHAFWQWARTILDGDWLGRNPYHPYFRWMEKIAPMETWERWRGGKEVFHQAPLYPYFVAGLLELKDSLNFVLLVQVVIGSLHPLIMFFLARRLFDDRAGLLAAALTALYGPFIFYEAVLLRDWLPPLIEPLIVFMALRARASRKPVAWLLTGCVMGVAGLIKETTFLLSIAVAAWLLVESDRPRRQMMRSTALLIAGFLLCVIPLVLRNAVVGLPLYAISSQGAGNFLIGLLASQDPVGLNSLDMGDIAVKTEGRSLDLVREALRSYHGDYWGLVQHQLLKLKGLVDSYEPPNNVSYYYGQDISPLLRFTVDYRLIFPLGLAGFLLLLMRRQEHILLYLYGFIAITVQMFTVILSRFRLELVPMLILCAAYFLNHVITKFRHQKWGQVIGLLSLVLAIGTIQQIWTSRYDPATAPTQYWDFTEYRMAARIYASRGRFDLATDELARFRDKTRHSPPDAQQFAIATADQGDYHLMWAKELIEKEKPDQARKETIVAEAVYSEQKLFNYPLYNLGAMYFKLDEPETGKTFLKRFLEMEPEGPQSEKARLLMAR